MGNELKDGVWFDVETPEQHACLKAYGKLATTLSPLWQARVQKGKWSGPGRYMLLKYTTRCPKNCCDDIVHAVLSEAEVAARRAEENPGECWIVIDPSGRDHNRHPANDRGMLVDWRFDYEITDVRDHAAFCDWLDALPLGVLTPVPDHEGYLVVRCKEG